MFSSSVSVKTINKYYISVVTATPTLCTVEIEAGGLRETYVLKLQRKVSHFILRSIAGENKLTFSAPITIEATIVKRRRQRRPISIKLREIFDDSRRKRGTYWPSIHTFNGVELREITLGCFMPEAHSRAEKSIFHRFQLENTNSAYPKEGSEKSNMSSDILGDIIDWVNDENGEDLAFFVDKNRFSHQNRDAAWHYLVQYFGETTSGDGHARDVMKANPALGMLCFDVTEHKQSKHPNNKRNRRLAQMFNVNLMELESSPAFPAACLIRKSSLAWLTAMNVERRDLENGRYDPKALLRLIPILVRNAGYGVSVTPASKNSIVLGGPVTDAQWEIHRALPDPLNQNVCLFVGLLGGDGGFAPHALVYMRALKEQGLLVYALGVSLTSPLVVADPGPSYCDAFSARQNDGHDFGIWAAALRKHPEIWRAQTLLFANDSMIPGTNSFDELFGKLEQTPYDVTGLTDSTISNLHLQSYFIHLNRRALETPEVKKFWDSVLSWKDKNRIINLYEIGMTSKFSTAGLTCGPLFPAPNTTNIGPSNPSIYCWKELIDNGFPFVKTQIIKDAIASGTIVDVIRFLDQNGFDASIIPGIIEVSNSANR
ncbi:rhamnan synthesis F family protein [Rhizobium sp. RM]|uniref:rhamnan synthesis F family protein n=1 Tax=Rhizobium sp. RM TaxID=2748079 RepID=UPI00110EB42E|nr:rhamnan synthesis F family protein [Rhizobium sp. RM]NWJ27274.1 hypothetical protein [Rhizobium sp. RM]TMV20334.1 hypothetical protein BJG94_09930 [Rhizobium sp. Td3]